MIDLRARKALNCLIREHVIKALVELSSAEEQRRLWLSDGRDGADVSSFEEVCCLLFDDSGLGHDMDRGASIFSSKIDSALANLSELLDEIDKHRPPLEIINDQTMIRVRVAAADILRALRQ